MRLGFGEYHNPDVDSGNVRRIAQDRFLETLNVFAPEVAEALHSHWQESLRISIGQLLLHRGTWVEKVDDDFRFRDDLAFLKATLISWAEPYHLLEDWVLTSAIYTLVNWDSAPPENPQLLGKDEMLHVIWAARFRCLLIA